jgi:hypothetical protein
MGTSRIYHCIGYGPEEKRGENNRRFRIVYPAMNRLEIMQETIKANKRCETVEYWIAQTMKGKQILGGEIVMANRVPKPKYINCVCKDGCFICRQSGVTTLKWLKGFQDWQIEMARTGGRL